MPLLKKILKGFETSTLINTLEKIISQEQESNRAMVATLEDLLGLMAESHLIHKGSTDSLQDLLAINRTLLGMQTELIEFSQEATALLLEMSGLVELKEYTDQINALIYKQMVSTRVSGESSSTKNDKPAS